jgi:hypothetical protein
MHHITSSLISHQGSTTSGHVSNLISSTCTTSYTCTSRNVNHSQ